MDCKFIFSLIATKQYKKLYNYLETRFIENSELCNNIAIIAINYRDKDLLFNIPHHPRYLMEVFANDIDSFKFFVNKEYLPDGNIPNYVWENVSLETAIYLDNLYDKNELHLPDYLDEINDKRVIDYFMSKYEQYQQEVKLLTKDQLEERIKNKKYIDYGCSDILFEKMKLSEYNEYPFLYYYICTEQMNFNELSEDEHEKILSLQHVIFGSNDEDDYENLLNRYYKEYFIHRE